MSVRKVAPVKPVVPNSPPYILVCIYVGLGGLVVTCSPQDPAEVDGFFYDVKFLSTSPPGGTSSRGSPV